MNWDKLASFLSNMLWIWLFFLMMQPALKQGMLEAARAAWLRRLEKSRGSRVIALVHRKESVNLLGFPLLEYIDIQDSEAVLRAIRLTAADVPIDVILHSPGGVSMAAEQIARALCRHKAKVTVFVPHYAMSGGTLIALAAHDLVMTQDSVLGALDPMVGQFPAASVLTIAGQKNFEEMSDDTYLLLDQAKKATEQMRATVKFLLAHRHDDKQVEKLTDAFTAGTWTQDYPIAVDELQELGLPVSCQMPAEVFQYMAMFPQASGGRPSVDFIPTPYSYPSQAPARRH